MNLMTEKSINNLQSASPTTTSTGNSTARKVVATFFRFLLPLIALIAGCGGDDQTEGGGSADGVDAGEPVRGGEGVYGLEAETSGGWCLTDSTLAISGIMVTPMPAPTICTSVDKELPSKPLRASADGVLQNAKA